MLYKVCGCGRARIPVGEARCPACAGNRKEYYKHYDKHTRTDGDVYTDRRWPVLTQQCKMMCDGLDLYQYHAQGKLMQGYVVHHIIEVKEDRARAFDPRNLIYVSDATHKWIHKQYNKGLKHKRRLQRELFACKFKHKKIKG